MLEFRGLVLILTSQRLTFSPSFEVEWQRESLQSKVTWLLSYKWTKWDSAVLSWRASEGIVRDKLATLHIDISKLHAATLLATSLEWSETRFKPVTHLQQDLRSCNPALVTMCKFTTAAVSTPTVDTRAASLTCLWRAGGDISTSLLHLSCSVYCLLKETNRHFVHAWPAAEEPTVTNEDIL